MKHEIHQKVELQGRYKAIKHKGHKFDENGELVEFGEVIEETGWGKNIITLVGINTWLGSASTLFIWAVAGTSNATPSEANTVLGAYAGRRTALPVGDTLTRQVDPLAGELYIRNVSRSTFNPGAFGASSVNIAEAGMAMSSTAPSSSTQLFSRGLLVDGGGSPTTISVAPDEYLDIVWEFTIYVPYGTTGTVSLTIDGVATNHTYVVRPVRLDGFSVWSSFAASAGTGPGYIPTITPTLGGADTNSYNGTSVNNGALTAPTVNPPMASASHRPTAVSWSAYIAGSKQRQCNATWSLTAGNVAAPGVQVAVMGLGWPSFQVSYSPPIAKTASKQLNLSFMLSFANR